LKVGFVGPSTGISIQQLIKLRVVLPKLQTNNFVFIQKSGRSNQEFIILATQVLKRKIQSVFCSYNQLVEKCDMIISMDEKQSKFSKKTILILPSGKDSVY